MLRGLSTSTILNLVDLSRTSV